MTSKIGWQFLGEEMIKYRFESPKEHLGVWMSELAVVSDDEKEKYAAKPTRKGLKKTVSIIDTKTNSEVSKIEYNMLLNSMLLSKMKIYVNGKEWGRVRRFPAVYTALELVSVDGHRIEGVHDGSREHCVKDKNGVTVFRYKWNPDVKIFMSPKRIAVFEIEDPNDKFPFIALAYALNVIPTSSSGV